MTDKVQKIRKEVEKRYKYWKEKESNSHSIESEIRMSECQHLLLMFDSLQEEPVSEDKMTISKEWFEHCKKSWYNEGYIDGEFNRDRQFEDSVSEELEKEIDSYFAKWLQGASDEGCFNSDSQLVSIYDCHRIAHHFAEWQKQHMMKDAVEVPIVEAVPAGSCKWKLCAKLWLDKGVKGNKVKLIIIKED